MKPDSKLTLSLYFLSTTFAFASKPVQLPNVIFIYTDDVGYGDLSCYGATKVSTPNIDKIAKNGVRFTDAHSTASTSTPSRYALLTGRYPWRVAGTDILPGDGACVIGTNEMTLPKVFKAKKYSTAVIGKWHLGLGEKKGQQDWNKKLYPGPKELGFDYSFIIPATGDRVPCVFIENQSVVNLDPNDPIEISYNKPFPGLPTGKNNPELLKMMNNPGGHDQAIVDSIGRIGYMKGGKSALWDDENIAQTLVKKAGNYIRSQKDHPFFLYFSTHDIHVPRVPNPMFAGKSGMGARGDVILQLDWTVGQLYELLDSLNLTENTIVIFSSDNGGVLDDGYKDGARDNLGDHRISGSLRGFKGSSWEGGTRVPTIVSWPAKCPKGVVSNARIMQIDLMASFAKMLSVKLPDDAAPDSFQMLNSWLGISNASRKYLIENNHHHVFSILQGDWKYIEPKSDSKKINEYYGVNADACLFNLKSDLGETKNLFKVEKSRALKLKVLLDKARSASKTRK